MSLVLRTANQVPREAVEALMVRGGHPSAHVSWYACYVWLAYRDDVLVGAMLAHPGHFKRRLSVPRSVRITNVILSGSTRERLTIARALVAYATRDLYRRGYDYGYVTLWRSHPWFDRIRHLMTLLGGTHAWTEPLGEGWTWPTSSRT